MGATFTPTTVSNQATNANYVRSQTLFGSQSIIEPDVYRDIVRPFQTDFTGFLENMSFTTSQEVRNLEFYHSEKDRVNEIIKVEANTAGSANGEKTLTVQSGYRETVSENNSPFIATGSATQIPVRKYDLVQFPNRVQASVVAVSGNTFTVRPTVTGTAIPAVDTDTEISNLGTIVGESSTAVASRTSRQNGYTNQMFTVRTTNTHSGYEAGEMTWFRNLGEALGIDGVGDMWSTETWMDEYERFYNSCEALLITADKLTNTDLADVSGFETVTIGNGYIPQVENNGIVRNYSTNVSLDDFESISFSLRKNSGTPDNQLWTDQTLSYDIDTILRTTTGLTAGGVVYFDRGGIVDKEIGFGFDKIKLAGYTYMKRDMRILDAPEYLGAGNAYQGMGMINPVGYTSAQFNGQTRKVPNARMVHAGRPGDSNWQNGMKEFVRTPEITGTDEFERNIIATKGLEMFGLKRFAQLNKTS